MIYLPAPYAFNQFVALFLGHPVDVNTLLVIKGVCYLPTTLKSLLAGRCAGEVFVFICLPNLRIISSSGWITLCLLASTILKGTPLIMYLCLLHNWALPHNQST